MDTADQHAAALAIVHEEAGRTLSKDDFDLCMRIAKRALPSDAAQAPMTDEQILRLADACGLYGVRRGALAFAREVLKDAAPVAPAAAAHSDDVAVDAFAAAMKEKLTQAREKGRGGWEQCDPALLSSLLREHVEKGDPRDVANFCMFLWSLGHRIEKAAQPDERAAFDAMEHQVLLGYDKSGDAIFGTDPVAHARATAPKTTGPIYQIGANAGGGIAWWDVDRDRYEREKKAGYMKTCVVYREGK